MKSTFQSSSFSSGWTQRAIAAPTSHDSISAALASKPNSLKNRLAIPAAKTTLVKSAIVRASNSLRFAPNTTPMVSITSRRQRVKATSRRPLSSTLLEAKPAILFIRRLRYAILRCALRSTLYAPRALAVTLTAALILTAPGMAGWALAETNNNATTSTPSTTAIAKQSAAQAANQFFGWADILARGIELIKPRTYVTDPNGSLFDPKTKAVQYNGVIPNPSGYATAGAETADVANAGTNETMNEADVIQYGLLSPQGAAAMGQTVHPAVFNEVQGSGTAIQSVDAAPRVATQQLTRIFQNTPELQKELAGNDADFAKADAQSVAEIGGIDQAVNSTQAEIDATAWAGDTSALGKTQFDSLDSLMSQASQVLTTAKANTPDGDAFTLSPGDQKHYDDLMKKIQTQVDALQKSANTMSADFQQAKADNEAAMKANEATLDLLQKLDRVQRAMP